MTTFGLLVLPALLLLAVCRGRLEIGVLTGIGLGQWLAGAYLTRDVHPRLFIVCLAGTAALVVGYGLAQRRDGSSEGDETRPLASASAAPYRPILGALGLVTVALVVFHFVRGGIPLFASNVEVARFEIANSGLFGIPSRAYLFGLPILVLAYASLPSRTRSEAVLSRVVAVAFVLSRILGGLKSGLFEVMFVALLAQILRSRATARVSSSVVVRRALVGVLAVVFAGYLSTQYATVHTRSVSGAANYLVKRVTIGTVAAGAYAIEHRGELDGGAPYLLADFLYYGNKYAGGRPAAWGLFAPPQYNASRVISSGLVGLPPSTSDYVTPIAIGLSASLFLDWGWLGVVLGMGLAGYLLRRLQWRAISRVGLSAGVSTTACLVGMYIVTNGGLAYYLLNFIGTTLLYAAAARAMLLLAPRRAAPSGGGVHRHVSPIV